MIEEARVNLRKGLDFLWEEFTREREEESSNNQVAQEYLEEIKTKLNNTEDLLKAGKIQEAAKIALRAGILLRTLKFRCALTFFRETERLQRERTQNTKEKEFSIRATHLLDQAEAFLDDGKIEEAKDILKQYTQEKTGRGGFKPHIPT